jgi:hypothetical protein
LEVVLGHERSVATLINVSRDKVHGNSRQRRQ